MAMLTAGSVPPNIFFCVLLVVVGLQILANISQDTKDVAAVVVAHVAVAIAVVLLLVKQDNAAVDIYVLVMYLAGNTASFTLAVVRRIRLELAWRRTERRVARIERQRTTTTPS